MVEEDRAQTIFTIGHSNHTGEEFIALLHEHAIEVLVDVRSQPYSKYANHFNSRSLQEAVAAAGMRYLFLGRELGGRPEGAYFYDDEGYVLYDRVAGSPLFLAGIERLQRGVEKYRVAIMCSEEDPAGCHRHLLVGRVLRARGVIVQHIRGDNTVQRDEDVASGSQGQLMLFDMQEVQPWKSIRSVSPRKQPENSSDS
jgi:uncharacterized protein (DUF488 family)